MTYPHRVRIPTRWMDTDAYGHVNNAQYYSLFDTAVTTWLVEEAGADPAQDPTIALCAESMCHFAAPLSFPEIVTAELRVAKVGRSSVRYEIALIGEAGGDPAATGYFVHVQVDRATRKPAPIPERVRNRLADLVVEETQVDGPKS